MANSAQTAGAVASAALPGIGSLLGPALFSFLPGLIGGLFGDPQRKLRKQINKLLASQGGLTNQLYKEGLASPAFAQAQGAIGTGANVASNQLAAALGARGIGTSGSAAVLSSLTPSLVGSQMAGLRTGIYNQAQAQAQQRIQQQIQALLGTQGPSPSQQLFGTGLEAFGPFLQDWLKARYPGTAGGTAGAVH